MNEKKDINKESVQKALDEMMSDIKKKETTDFPKEFPYLNGKLEDKNLKLEHKIFHINYALSKLKRFAIKQIEVNENYKFQNNTNQMLEDIATEKFKYVLVNYIAKKEGFFCSSNKASFITEKVIQHLKENKNISIYRTYSKKMDGDWLKNEKMYGKPCYWCTHLFKNTEEVINWYLKYLKIKESFDDLLKSSDIKQLEDIDNKLKNVKK